MTQTKEDYVGTVLPEMGTVGQSTSVDTTLKQGKVKVKVKVKVKGQGQIKRWGHCIHFCPLT